MLTGCENDITNTKEYKAGYTAGYQNGLNQGNDFKRGYERELRKLALKFARWGMTMAMPMALKPRDQEPVGG